MTAVKISPLKFTHTWGYDLRICDSRATVQDYLDALNRAITELPLTRGRKQVQACAGCDLCCAERAPLTWIDVLTLQGCLQGKHQSLPRFLSRIGLIRVDGPIVDITLRRDDEEHCIFLDRQQRICSVYPARPLVCQTFICCTLSPAAARVRELVVNLGEDELVRQWLAEAKARGTEPRFHAGYRPRPQLADWPSNAFSGKTAYRQVLLQGILPPDLWRRIFTPDPKVKGPAGSETKKAD